MFTSAKGSLTDRNRLCPMTGGDPKSALPDKTSGRSRQMPRESLPAKLPASKLTRHFSTDSTPRPDASRFSRKRESLIAGQTPQPRPESQTPTQRPVPTESSVPLQARTDHADHCSPTPQTAGTVAFPEPFRDCCCTRTADEDAVISPY